MQRLVAATSARQRRALWTEALAWAGAALIDGLALSGFLAAWSVIAGRIVLGLAVVGFGVIVGWFGARRIRTRLGDATKTARFVGARAPALGEDALSAVELHAELDRSPSFSLELARAFLADVDARATKVAPESVVDARPARRATLGLVATFALALVAVFVWRSAWLRGMTDALALGERARAVVHYEPITGDIQLTYKYPAYTGLPLRTVQGASGEISAPAGTEVQLRTRADRPVRRAEIVVNGVALPLQVENERDLLGSFTVEAPGSYHFRFLNAFGRESDRGPDLPINVEADTAPKVSLLLPGEDVEVDPGEKLTLRYEATDDYGLTGLELVFRTPGGKEQRVKLPREDGRATRETWSWDLGGMKLKPGDRITYFVEATDNDAIAGPKRGVSRTQVVRIYSAEEHLREARQQVEQMWERLITQLGDRLEGGEAEGLGRDQVTQNARVDEAGMQLVQDLRALGATLSEARDPPTELINALATVASSYGEAVRRTRDIRRFFVRYGDRSDLFGDFGRRLQTAVREEIAELEKDVLYLEALIDRRKLEELRTLARELNSERRELASLMENYKQTKDPDVREQILQQIQELRRRMEELSQKMMELSKSIRDEHLNAEALDEMMQDRDMSSQLDEVERLMREGKVDEAMKKLQELSMQMDEMEKNLEEQDESFGEDQFPELTRKFGDFMKDLAETTEQQKALSEKTKALRDRYREKLKERIQQKADALKKGLLEKVEQAAKDYRSLDPERLNLGAERPLAQVQTELENVKNALKVEDYDLAAEAAARAERAAEELEALGEAQAQNDQLWGNPPEVQKESREFAQRLSKDAKQVREVNQQLQQLFPPAGQMMSAEDQQQLQKLAQEQQQLQKRAQGLQQQMDEMGQMAPIFDENARQQMEQVGRSMGEAQQQMQGRDPARAFGEQQAALEQLQKFQEQMQQSRGGKGGRGLPMPMYAGPRRGNGRGSPQDKVEIPDADQYQAPKEFRKDLLDAMKQGAPEKYREQVKRYYEELVR
ncbi:MAG: DUF4175 family protein [Myxococcaceae bacterium]|nr:DUF4175 family protein [Myxococcaceae bacterium]